MAGAMRAATRAALKKPNPNKIANSITPGSPN
jgi:hypothetical protein